MVPNRLRIIKKIKLSRTMVRGHSPFPKVESVLVPLSTNFAYNGEETVTNREINKIFGDRLSALRRNRAMTQEDLAQVTGISVDFISLLERGTKGPTLVTMVKLAEGLGISLADLINFDEKFDWQK